MLPTLRDNTDYNKAMAYRSIYLEKMQADLKSRVNPSEKLLIGDAVRIENHITGYWDKTGIIEGIRDNGKSYLVAQDEGGRLLLRNRRHVKPMEGLAGGDDDEDSPGRPDRQKSHSLEDVGVEGVSKKFGCSQRRPGSLDNLKMKVRFQLPNEAEKDQLDAVNGQDAPFRNTRSFGGILK